MKTAYVVRTIPVRGARGDVLGFVRVDLFADGTRPTDMVILRDGTAWGQAAALERVLRDPELLWPTRDAAVRDGFALLRKADSQGRTEKP